MPVQAKSVISLVEELTSGLVLRERLGVKMGDCCLEVKSNSRALLEKLAYYFKDFLHPPENPDIVILAVEQSPPDLGLDFTVKTPDPGKTKIKEEYFDAPDGRVVRKRLTTMQFLFGAEHHLAIGPCLKNDNQVINFVNNRYIEWCLRSDHLLCHAAAVTHNGQGLAMAGRSGKGKSTLSLRFMAQGTTFVSNDRLMIKNGPEGLRMTGVAKLPRINPGTILHNDHLLHIIEPSERETLAALPGEELWKLEQKYDVFLDQCFGPGRFQLSAPMNGLLLLNWEFGAGPFRLERIDPAERLDLLEGFMKPAGLFYLPLGDDPPPDRPHQDYLDVLGDCPVYELSGGIDFEGAATACLKLLE